MAIAWHTGVAVAVDRGRYVVCMDHGEQVAIH